RAAAPADRGATLGEVTAAAATTPRARPSAALARSYAYSFAGWLAFGVLLHWHEHLFWGGGEPLWPRIAIEPLLEYGPFALLWPLVLAAARRIAAGSGARLPRLLCLWLLATLLGVLLNALARWCAMPGPPAPGRPQTLPLWLVDELARNVVFRAFLWAGVVG